MMERRERMFEGRDRRRDTSERFKVGKDERVGKVRTSSSK